MRRKTRVILLTGTSLSFLIGLSFFEILPRWIDARVNGRFLSSTKVQESPFHEQLFVSDLHSDALMWSRDLLTEHSRGHVDLPRLQKGHVALQGFSVVSSAPLFPNPVKNKQHPDGITVLGVAQKWPVGTWQSLNQRTLYMARRMHEAVEHSHGQLRLIRNKTNLEDLLEARKKDPRVVGAWLTIEGAHALDGDPNHLEELYHLGFRMIGPAHLFDNDVSGSQSGEQKYGLTELGRKILQKMESLGMIVDLAHTSPQAFEEILSLTKAPVLVSHTGVKAVCAIDRNLTDDQIKKVAARGGLIGIGFWDTVLCSRDIVPIIKSIQHVCQLVGCDHVALGSDWDGFVTTAIDASQISLITEKLLEAGFSKEDTAAIMGGNVLHFLQAHLPP